MTFAGYAVIPVHEGALGVVPPCPHVQLEVRRQSVAVGTINVAYNGWRDLGGLGMLRLVATRAAFRSHLQRMDANIRPQLLASVAVAMARDVANFPEFSGERNKVCCVVYEL